MNHPGTLHVNMDIDPLSSYEYPSYGSYPTLAPTQPYPYQVKDETLYYQHNNSNYVPNGLTSQQEYKNELPALEKKKEEVTDTKDMKSLPTRRKKDKKGQKSTYCSEKITDAAFPFYGCSVCNISYQALHELDQHVTIHKNRMTSYRLRLRNQFKKKQIKKEKKKLKKMIKFKKEKDLDIEIKPEDGYIGNDKAADFINNDCNGTVSNSECNGISAMQPNSVINETKSVDIQNNSLSNGNENNENHENNGNDVNNKDNIMEEKELNNLEKIYKCFACQKQFTLSYYLKLHVRSHTDEKPYKCNACGQSFITASKLGRHDKRIHQTARFQCRICFKVFLRFELLTTHFDKHHPEDKLEGEPYDYNAILPYLKELEEQLKEQSEEKPKTEDPAFEDPAFGDPGFGDLDTHQVTLHEEVEIKEENPDDDQKDFLPKLDILVEEVKVDYDDVSVKREVSDDEAAGDLGDPGDPGDLGDPADDRRSDEELKQDVKDEDSASDEDYFPPNTWASMPAPASPAQARRRAGGAGGGPGGGARQCGVCLKRVSSASYLRVHLRTHTGERPFKCYTCGRGFITSSKMHRHVLTHQQDGGVKKEEEGAAGEGGDAVEGEGGDTNIDEDDLPIRPKKSSKKKGKTKGSNMSQLNGEEKPRRKHQKRPHSCQYCNQKFLHLNMLEVHRKCHEGEPLVLKCHYCLEEAADEPGLRAHEAGHVGAKPYLCTICGKTYKKRETMVYHRKHHKPDQEFVCDVCSKRFPAACKLHKHQLTHRAEQFVLRYECPVCAHMFHTKYHVRMHLGTHQKEGLILEENRNEILAMVLQNARKIPKQASTPTSLPSLPSSLPAALPPGSLPPAQPADERSRVCNICGEVFHHFFYLEEHLKSHGSRIAVEDLVKEEDKKYICTVCNKGFKLHYYLKLHTFTHSKEKPFICQQCGKGFITKGKLKRHLETHTGLKKYQCHICYKFFTRPSYLRIHIRTIHGTQDYNFRFDKGYGSRADALQASAIIRMGEHNAV